MKWRDVGINEVYFIEPTAGLNKAASLMTRCNVGTLPVGWKTMDIFCAIVAVLGNNLDKTALGKVACSLSAD